MKSVADSVHRYARAIEFARLLPRAAIHRLSEASRRACVSDETARRRIKELAEIGLARHQRGWFTVRHDAVIQPAEVLKSMLPSLRALGSARRFGRYYRETDVNFARKHLPEGAFVTLDYPLAELVGYQSAWHYFVCVDDPDAFASFLAGRGFKGGRAGRVVVLPKMGSFKDRIGRLFLDCLADGGRSIGNAIALSMMHGGSLDMQAVFSKGEVDSVLQHVQGGRSPRPAA